MQTEGAVLKVGGSSLRLRLVGESEPVTLRAALGLGEMVPGEAAEVEIDRRWQFKGYAYASGRVLSSRVDVARLGLAPLPLPLRVHGRWRPGPAGDDVEWFGVSATARALLPGAALPDCEMEQVIPGFDVDTEAPDADLAIEAAKRAKAGDIGRGLDILARAVDLRYLDGHAHMGSVILRRPRRASVALRDYTVGVAIGRSFLPAGFRGYLRAAGVSNRPFLRCLHGVGLCQGATGDIGGARETLLELLRYDPQDRGGAEVLLRDLDRGGHDTWLTD